MERGWVGNGMGRGPGGFAPGFWSTSAKGLILISAVEISLKRQRILRGRVGVDPKASPPLAPRVRRIDSSGHDSVSAIEIFAVNAEINIRRERATVTHACKISQHRSSSLLRIKSLRVFR